MRQVNAVLQPRDPRPSCFPDIAVTRTSLAHESHVPGRHPINPLSVLALGHICGSTLPSSLRRASRLDRHVDERGRSRGDINLNAHRSLRRLRPFTAHNSERCCVGAIGRGETVDDVRDDFDLAIAD